MAVVAWAAVATEEVSAVATEEETVPTVDLAASEEAAVSATASEEAGTWAEVMAA